MRIALLSTAALAAVLYGLPALAQDAPERLKRPPENSRSEGRPGNGGQERAAPAESTRPGAAGRANSDSSAQPSPGGPPMERAGSTGNPSDARRSAEPAASNAETPARARRTDSSRSDEAREEQKSAPAQASSGSAEDNASANKPKEAASEQRRRNGDATRNQGGRRGAGSDGDAASRRDTANPANAPASEGTDAAAGSQKDSGSSSAASEQTRRGGDRQDAARSSEGAGISAEISGEERTRITRSFTSRKIEPVTNVNFTISVGTTIPQRITLHQVPADVVRLVPQYRGYRYTIVEDEIVIIEPRTRRIVDVIDRSGTTASVSSSSSRRSLNLSRTERASVLRTLRSDDEALFRAGATIPQCIELRPMPQSVEVPELRSYRYLVAGGNVLVVEPETRRVVEVLK